MDQTLFQLSFTGYGLACMLAMAVGLGLCLIGPRRQGPGWSGFVRFAVCVMFFTLLCARLMFVLPDLLMGLLSQADIIKEHNSIFLDAIGSAVPALFFWNGGYSLAGAIPGAILGAKLAEKWTRVPAGFWRDRLAIGLPAAILIERAAEWGTGLGTGMETTAPWLNRLGFTDHPLWLYEALLALVVLGVMIALTCLRRRLRIAPGDLLRLFLICFCLPLAAIEALRPLTGHMVIHFVNVTQVMAAVMAMCIWVRWWIRLLRNRSRPKSLKIPLLSAGAVLTLAALGAAVYCIFGMEKDWVSRGTAYLLIALCMAVIGCIALMLWGFSRREGADANGTQKD